MMPTCSRLRKHTTLLCLSVSSFDRSFRMSFCDFLSLLSTDSDSTRQQIPHVIVIFQRRMQPVSHNINEFLAELWTHVSCFDQINFMNRVGMPFVTNVRNDLWFPTFVIKYCFVFFFLRMSGREATGLSAFFPASSSCNQSSQQNFVEVLLGT